MGIEAYFTRTRGTSGRIKSEVEDFVVEEVLINGDAARVNVKYDFEGGVGSFLICVLVKRNRDTLLVCDEISKRMRIPRELVSFSGIKDKRALTAQFISIRGTKPEEAASISVPGVKLIPVKYAMEPLSPKLLLGNRFFIRIRDVSKEADRVSKEFEEEIRAGGGVPNFFGYQRFGSVRPITHVVGRHLIRREFEEAVMEFLCRTSPHESRRVGELRRLAEEGNFRRAYEEFPKRLVYERVLLRRLSRKPRGFLYALRGLPTRILRFFVEAYQSYLFNKFLSERMRRSLSILEPEIGDYITFLNEHGLPTSRSAMYNVNNLKMLGEEVRRGRACISIPLVGYKQETSSGYQGEIENEILEREGVRPHMFKIKKLGISSPGGLRPVRSTPIDLNFQIFHSNGRRDLILRLFLRRGEYASTLLRELMKPKDPVQSGF